MGFTHAQATAHANSAVAGTLTLTATLGSAPAVGDVVCVSVLTFNSAPTVTVKDGAATPNTYTQRTSSTTFDTTAGTVWLFSFVANATANAAITVTVSTNPSGVLSMFVDDFTVSGGTAAFDTAIAGSGSTGTTTTSPTITPSGSNELLYAGGAFATAGTGATGSWTQNSVGVDATFGNDAAYDLSASAGVVVQFTMGGSQNYDTAAMAFSFTASNAVFDDDSIPLLHFTPAETNISVWG